MQYEVSKLSKNNLSLNKGLIFAVIGLYCFVLGTSLLGFSIYLFLESSGFVEQTFINWSGQGLFWSFITLFISLFVLFIPVEFFSKYFIENRSFKDLLTNIVSVIFVSLFFLVVFQILLRNQNVFIKPLVDRERGNLKLIAPFVKDLQVSIKDILKEQGLDVGNKTIKFK